jgi:hypothetical protein
MWVAFKNVETGIVHAVSLPAGMSPHGCAMDWPLAETNEPLTCHLCLQFAFRWRNQDTGLKAMLPPDLCGREVPERRSMICGVPVSQCCC